MVFLTKVGAHTSLQLYPGHCLRRQCHKVTSVAPAATSRLCFQGENSPNRFFPVLRMQNSTAGRALSGELFFSTGPENTFWAVFSSPSPIYFYPMNCSPSLFTLIPSSQRDQGAQVFHLLCLEGAKYQGDFLREKKAGSQG